MRYIRKTYHETGEVVRTPVCTGQPRTLDSLDVNVSHLLFSVSLTNNYLVPRGMYRATTGHLTHRNARSTMGDMWYRGFDVNHFENDV